MKVKFKKAVAVAISLMICTPALASDGFKIKLNNSIIEFDESSQYPTEVDGKKYIPLRKLAESANAEVDWVDGYAVINIRQNEVKIKNGESFAIVNGEKMSLIYEAKILNDRIFLSLEDVKNVLGLVDDMSAFEEGIAVHQEFYGKDDKFFNLVTTFNGDAHMSRAFSWEAQPDYDNMVLQYMKKGSDEVIEIKADCIKFPVSFVNNTVYDMDIKIYDAETVSEMQDMLFYKAKIENLEPGTSYTYRIGDKSKDEWGEYFDFTTEAEDTDSFSIIAVTDPQGRVPSEYEYYKKTLETALDDCPDAAFVINMGDFTDNANYDDWWKYFFDASVSKESLPLMTAIGNHENRGDGAKYYNIRFFNPQNGLGLGDGYESTGNDERVFPIIKNLDNTVYSFDYGDTHFTVLNTGTDWNNDQMVPLLEMQKDWLENDLKSTDKEWKVLMLHIGIYVQKVRGNHTKEIFGDIIDRYGVDLVIEGHDHTYMRTYQMYNGEPVSDELSNYKKGEGTLYSIIGSAALKRYETKEEHPWTAVLSALPKEIPSYTVIEFSPEKMNFTTKLTDGTVIDKFTISKEK